MEERKIPAHVAIIMDGNGRWATSRGLPRVMGHNAGMKAMKEIVKKADQMGIRYLTVYAFSTENWKRSEEEVGGIFKLLVSYVASELRGLQENNVRVNVLGDWSALPGPAKKALETLLEGTKDCDGLQFNIALNYGSRDEIIMAVRSLAAKAAEGELDPEAIGPDEISAELYTGRLGIPDPDLVIRTSGEVRLSNFLLWQVAYSEMVFTPVYWPDFTPEEFEKTIAQFGARDRRFGGR